MIDRFSPSDLRDLASTRKGPCVTMYLPTNHAGNDSQQNPIRLKNLVRLAEQKLAGHWMRDVQAREFVLPIKQLIGDDMFWQNISKGLSLFLTDDEFYYWRVDVQLEELLAVKDQFYLRPMLSAVLGDDRFYVLAVSQNKVDLFEATKSTIERLEIPALPKNITEFLNLSSVDRGTQVHSAAQGSGTGKQAAVFHGQGGKPESNKDDLRQYFREINSVVTQRLRKQSHPLVLACVDYQVAIYRELNSYSNLLEQAVLGNADYLTPKELQQRAWPLVQAHLDSPREQALSEYHQLAGSKRASSQPVEILSAAQQGRVHSLFINQSASLFGEFDATRKTIEPSDGLQEADNDLIETALVQSILHRGNVYALTRDTMPADAPMMATFRY